MGRVAVFDASFVISYLGCRLFYVFFVKQKTAYEVRISDWSSDVCSSALPLYILYTSGTTGIAKGVVHDNGGHAVAMAWSVPNVYGVGRDDVFWSASDIGWAVGHSYIVYGPLIHGCTSVMYEGKPVGTDRKSTRLKSSH